MGLTDFLEIFALLLSPVIWFGLVFVWWGVRRTYFKVRCPICHVRALEDRTFRIIGMRRVIGSTNGPSSIYHCDSCDARLKWCDHQWSQVDEQEWRESVERIFDEHEAEEKSLSPSVFEPRDYGEHETKYVFTYFGHFMTTMEKLAAESQDVFAGEQPVKIKRLLVWPPLARKANLALSQGYPTFARRTTDRLISAHRPQIFANACPTCGKLPATPQARLCIWCGKIWTLKR